MAPAELPQQRTDRRGTWSCRFLQAGRGHQGSAGTRVWDRVASRSSSGSCPEPAFSRHPRAGNRGFLRGRLPSRVRVTTPVSPGGRPHITPSADVRARRRRQGHVPATFRRVHARQNFAHPVNQLVQKRAGMRVPTHSTAVSGSTPPGRFPAHIWRQTSPGSFQTAGAEPTSR